MNDFDEFVNRWGEGNTPGRSGNGRNSWRGKLWVAGNQNQAENRQPEDVRPGGVILHKGDCNRFEDIKSVLLVSRSSNLS